MRYLDLRHQEQLLANWRRLNWQHFLPEKPANSELSSLTIIDLSHVESAILRDSRLKLAGLSVTKISTILQATSLILLLQDPALPLAGKKIACLIELYGSAKYRYWQAQTTIIPATPEIPLSLLEKNNFVACSQAVLLRLLYASDYHWLSEQLCSYLSFGEHNHEIESYWQQFSTSQLISALELSFRHFCRSSFSSTAFL